MADQREALKRAIYDDLCAADNQDVPLEEYPERILQVIDAFNRSLVDMATRPSEVEKLRAAQARDVMPLIGSLLDSFEQLATDLKTDPELEQLVGHLQAIEDVMLTAEPSAP